MKRFTIFLICSVIALLMTEQSSAQEAINFDSALQPGLGSTIMRSQLRYFEAERRAPGVSIDIEQYMVSTTFVHGLRSDVTLIFNAKHHFRERDFNLTGASDDDNGFGDVRMLGKFQLFSEDTGVNSTERVSLLSGLEIRSGDSTFSSDSYDPLLGLVYTKGADRLGINAAVLWKFNTAGGVHDEVHYDGAITYRLHPERYGAGKVTALFGILELNGIYETNGDDELFFSPGVQYVTSQWALEATVQIPSTVSVG